ncbi:MAG: hypothetical protein KME12_05645 [Trichocoleus desertorum ATA4-8-CV12]|nr:hypothetical protein [Trichocoleus desertorum ATA4-8-CV12]
MTEPSNNSSEDSPEKPSIKSFLKRRSLINASKQELEQVALNFLKVDNLQFKVLNGSPKVVLNLPITLPELEAIDLGFSPIGEVPPLALVVIKGNFDATEFVPSVEDDGKLKPFKTQYIAYVVDLRAGVPTLTAAGLSGKYFRDVLNDPDIPDEPKTPIGPETGQPETLPGPNIQSLPKLPYGSLIPGGSKPERPNAPNQ